MDTNSSLGNPKPMLAFQFLRALARINQQANPHSNPGASFLIPQSRRIRRAAYASMASAAGPRRAWSRALLRRIQSRRRRRMTRVVVAPKRIRVLRPRPRPQQEPTRADALRRLVPGGKSMDYCSLLEETANYVMCLTAQVQLMETIANSGSCSS